MNVEYIAHFITTRSTNNQVHLKIQKNRWKQKI